MQSTEILKEFGKALLNEMTQMFEEESNVVIPFTEDSLREICSIYGFDYNDVLRAFKAENPSFSKMASAVIIVTQSGFKKLMKAYKTDADIKKLFIESKTPALPEKSSGSVEISLDQKPRAHGDIFEKYRSLGVYKQADVDKLVEKYGIFVNGQNCLPVSVAKKFFIPLAVSTVVAEINGGDRCLIKAEILNDEDPNESYLCTLKVLNRHGISEVVTAHNAFLTGEIKFYEKGKAPVK